jgi:2-succinyl-5-enolpyruvyl-6-hydroxy-3-cyclohexene-1-carboxylate synthase
VRWFHELPLPEPGEAAERLARSVARRAVVAALGSAPGPVHLNWPLREPLTPPPGLAPPPRESRPRVCSASRAAAPSESEIAALVSLARSEERGVVVAGPLPVSSELAEPVAAFARAARWPLLADAGSQLRCGAHVEGAPVASAYELFLRHGELARACAPRAVVRLGSAPTSKALRLWLEASPPTDYWLLDPYAQWSDASRLATERSGADPAQLLAAVASRIGALRRTGAWEARFTRAERAAQAVIARELEGEPALLEPRLARELAAQLPDGALLALSNSMAVRDADAFLPASRQRIRVLVNRGASGIDGVTSTALGASRAWPGPTVLLTGDLAFLHDLGGLSAARHAGNLTVVVVQNDGGGIFSYLPIAEHGEAVAFERLFRTPHGLDLRHAGPLFGVSYERVGSWEHFRAALKAALAHPGVDVVEVPVDPDASLRSFRSLARAAASAAWEAQR